MNAPTTNRGPNQLEAFKQNFRNMGVVKETETKPATSQVKVVATPKGVNLTNIRAKGFDFDLDDCWVNKDGTMTLWFTVN